MIIVMKSGASRADIDRICGRVEARGLKTHLSEGEDRTVIGVIGHDPFSVKDAFTHDPSVEDVIRITRPYKLSGREFRRSDTVIGRGRATKRPLRRSARTSATSSNSGCAPIPGLASYAARVTKMP